MTFSEQMIQRVWEKGSKNGVSDTVNWRKDSCTAWIKRRDYGKEGKYGWEIDHIIPVSRGGSDSLSNLQPLHWMNNRAKADGRQQCPVKSSGDKNVGL